MEQMKPLIRTLNSMRAFLLLLFLLVVCAGSVSAQTEADRLHVSTIDSIINTRERLSGQLKYMPLIDTVRTRRVESEHYNGKRTAIQVKEIDCESIYFYLHEDSLVCIRYMLSDPDERSMKPPSRTYSFYYRSDLQVYAAVEQWLGGAKSCSSFSVQQHDWIRDYTYFRDLKPAGER
jgi:cell division protein FtsL